MWKRQMRKPRDEDCATIHQKRPDMQTATTFIVELPKKNAPTQSDEAIALWPDCRQQSVVSTSPPFRPSMDDPASRCRSHDQVSAQRGRSAAPTRWYRPSRRGAARSAAMISDLRRIGTRSRESSARCWNTRRLPSRTGSDKATTSDLGGENGSSFTIRPAAPGRRAPAALLGVAGTRCPIDGALRVFSCSC